MKRKIQKLQRKIKKLVPQLKAKALLAAMKMRELLGKLNKISGSINLIITLIVLVKVTAIQANIDLLMNSLPPILVTLLLTTAQGLNAVGSQLERILEIFDTTGS